jgi:hypothetical protein
MIWKAEKPRRQLSTLRRDFSLIYLKKPHIYLELLSPLLLSIRTDGKIPISIKSLEEPVSLFKGV